MLPAEGLGPWADADLALGAGRGRLRHFGQHVSFTDPAGEAPEDGRIDAVLTDGVTGPWTDAQTPITGRLDRGGRLGLAREAGWQRHRLAKIGGRLCLGRGRNH